MCPILATKLYIPSPRSDSVQRIPLLERLNRGMDQKLTLICAPAGFGKTTLISEWIPQSDKTVCWLSLDRNDNDVFRFLNYLIAAINRISPEFGSDSLPMLQPSQLQVLDAILMGLSKELSEITEELVIIMDDYHVIDTEDIHHAVNFLLEYIPENIHLVIATRVDPPLPLARMRVRNQLTELRSADLCFTTDETSRFLNDILGMNLSLDDIGRIITRTEGWIAGIQLAALSLKGRSDASAFIESFAGNDRHVVDYLTEEVLSRQPERIQKFLSQTSILNRLSGPLCDFVTSNAGSQEILENLEKTNLFIVPLDNKRNWYRYHHLFAELLQHRLQQTEGDAVKLLHSKASEWYEKNESTDEAVEHALIAGDFQHSAHLMGEFVKKAWDFGGNTQMLKWFKQLPDDIVHRDAELSFFNAWMLFEHGRYDTAEENLRIVEQLISNQCINEHDGTEKTDSVNHQNQRELSGKIAVIRAFIASFLGCTQNVIRQAKVALEHLPEDSTSWRATASITLGEAHNLLGQIKIADKLYTEAAAVGKKNGNFFLYLVGKLRLAEIRKQQGVLADVIDIFNELLHTAEERGLNRMPMMGWLFNQWSDTLREMNQLDEAQQCVQTGLELSRQGKDAAMTGLCYLYSAKLMFTRGDLVGAGCEIKKIEDLTRQFDIPLFVAEPLKALEIKIRLRANKLKSALEWLEEIETGLSGRIRFSKEAVDISASRILMASGRWDESLEITETHLRQAEKEGRIMRMIEMLVIRSMAYYSKGDTAKSLSSMEKALRLAQPGGFFNIFIDEGPVVSEILETMLEEKTNIQKDYLKRLITAFRTNRFIRTEDQLVERLSDRELEVLRLTAAGLSNNQLTKELFISLSTVKTHLRNIYSKLNVNSRTQAIAKSKELDLL